VVKKKKKKKKKQWDNGKENEAAYGHRCEEEQERTLAQGPQSGKITIPGRVQEGSNRTVRGTRGCEESKDWDYAFKSRHLHKRSPSKRPGWGLLRWSPTFWHPKARRRAQGEEKGVGSSHPV